MSNSLSFEIVSILDSSHQAIHSIHNKTPTVFVVNSEFIKKEPSSRYFKVSRNQIEIFFRQNFENNALMCLRESVANHKWFEYKV